MVPKICLKQVQLCVQRGGGTLPTRCNYLIINLLRNYNMYKETRHSTWRCVTFGHPVQTVNTAGCPFRLTNHLPSIDGPINPSARKWISVGRARYQIAGGIQPSWRHFRFRGFIVYTSHSTREPNFSILLRLYHVCIQSPHNKPVDSLNDVSSNTRVIRISVL